MNNTKLSFAIDASQIDIKPLLKKEFLELSMRAISSANPNKNNSWFTKESMEKGIQTFKNKPILGYFENGDFVSHNGEWSSDPETDMDYWNTLGQKGERILGLIRSEDDVQIIEDKDGLSWICLTCALWTQYSYKQVKRLLKDAKRAKANGGVTKNISVEVDITDYEYLPNGVMKINDFNLVGITILGSRNGVKVEPGIENAELSVVDVMGKEFFEKQQSALRLAYEKLDNSSKQENNEEGESQMEVDEKVVSQLEENVDVCPECGENPCVCEKEEQPLVEEQETFEEEKQEESEESQSETSFEEAKTEEEVVETFEEEKCEEEQPESEEQPEEDEKDEEDEDEEEHEEEEKCEEEQCEEQCSEEGCPLEEVHEECGEEHFEEQEVVENKNYEEEIAQLTQSYKELEEKYEEALSKIKVFEKAEFLKEVKTVLDSVESLTEEQRNDFMLKCKNDEITSIDDLKIDVALIAIFNNSIKRYVESDVEKTEIYSAPVISPNTSIFGGKAEKTAKEDKWDKLREYTGRN